MPHSGHCLCVHLDYSSGLIEQANYLVGEWHRSFKGRFNITHPKFILSSNLFKSFSITSISVGYGISEFCTQSRNVCCVQNVKNKRADKKLWIVKFEIMNPEFPILRQLPDWDQIKRWYQWESLNICHAVFIGLNCSLVFARKQFMDCCL